MQNWSVYIIRCLDGSLYTGISTDVERRFKEHCNINGAKKGTQKGAPKGAKYFRKSPPESVVYRESNMTRSQASRREAQIKALTREDKIRLILAEPELTIFQTPARGQP